MAPHPGGTPPREWHPTREVLHQENGTPPERHSTKIMAPHPGGTPPRDWHPTQEASTERLAGEVSLARLDDRIESNYL
ncbi:hypothetical protein ACLB2K_007122 [Fragaria x ananassa]